MMIPMTVERLNLPQIFVAQLQSDVCVCTHETDGKLSVRLRGYGLH